jgi:uncharacterized protein
MKEHMTPKPRRRKKPLFEDVAGDFEKSLLSNVLPAIASSGDRYVAIGIDMAAQEGNWGISVITTNNDLSRGSPLLLLPHHHNLEGFKQKHLIKPKSVFIGELLKGLTDYRIPVAVAVDVPFGWPQEHSSFLEEWSAVPVPGKALSPPTRDQFEYRLCDREMMGVLKKEGRSPAILPVGADKIASAAFVWANQQRVLNALGQVDIGYVQPSTEGVVFFETYPSAFVRLNYSLFAGYKTLKKEEVSEDTPVDAAQPAERRARHKILDAIKQEYSIDVTLCARNIEAACSTPASDAFDGFLSAIAAWDYLMWRFRQQSTIRMSSPTELLGIQRAEKEKTRIKKEGWILVRLPRSFLAVVDQCPLGGEDSDKRKTSMQIITVKIEKPDETNFILGQTHFIKTVEDIHEALVTAVPGIKFGLAFCEASGKCLVRWSGTDADMTELAKNNAAAIGAGHSFIVFLGDGFYPLNVLNTLKMVPEVCRIFCATANPTNVVLAEMDQGRGILGVVDGFSPKGIEDENDIKWRKDFLRQIGYKQ